MNRKPEPLHWREVAQAVRRQHIGRSVIYRETVDSTMEVCHELARAAADPGVVVVADAQSAGRGRQGRTWQAPPYTCLLFSVLLRPTLERDRWLHVLWPLALALQEATQRVTGIRAAIKWPNDLVMDGKKLGGLLAETAPNGVVVGAGLNVNFPATDLALDRPVATVRDVLGRPTSREALLIASLRSLQQWYDRWLATPEEVWHAWRAASSLLGKPVEITVRGQVYSGVAEELDRDGRLCLRLTNGELQRFPAGDASVQLGGRQ